MAYPFRISSDLLTWLYYLIYSPKHTTVTSRLLAGNSECLLLCIRSSACMVGFPLSWTLWSTFAPLTEYRRSAIFLEPCTENVVSHVVQSKILSYHSHALMKPGYSQAASCCWQKQQHLLEERHLAQVPILLCTFCYYSEACKWQAPSSAEQSNIPNQVLAQLSMLL